MNTLTPKPGPFLLADRHFDRLEAGSAPMLISQVSPKVSPADSSFSHLRGPNSPYEPAAGECEVLYWRDRNFEVDFIIRQGQVVAAIEVKSGRAFRGLFRRL